MDHSNAAGIGLRDEAWLSDRVSLLWEVHFSDVPRGYSIVTKYGSRARYRFGSICARNGVTVIKLNPLFAHLYVPVYVLDATLGHELAHYAHGYGSGLPKVHAHAHRGGVVDKELENRGLGTLYTRAAEWRAAYWEAFYEKMCGDITSQKSVREMVQAEGWARWHRQSGIRTQTVLAARLSEMRQRLSAAGLPTHEFTVEWLPASARQAALSYWYAKERTLRLHGLAADPRVPQAVVDFEIAYWLVRLSVGSKWEIVHAALKKVGLEPTAKQALDWRKRFWEAFHRCNYPSV